MTTNRCRNCGRLITMSNISMSIFNIPGVCNDCNKANTGLNAVLMINRLEKEDKDLRRERNDMDNKARQDRMNIKRENEELERAKRNASNLLWEIKNAPIIAEHERKMQIIRDEKEAKEKIESEKRELIMREKEKKRKKETRELWVYLLRKGEISALDDIELDETGDNYTIIPMGKVAHCPAAVQYRQENK
jgi:hypothetical protein